MRRAKRVKARGGQWATCPFCKYPGVHLGNPCAWCAGCHVRYRVEERRTGTFAVFDPNMGPRSFGEALAMAISKSGGARIGTPKEKP